MRIPKVISKNNREYIFVEQCNEKLFLYQEMITGYKECFTIYDLGYRTTQIEDKNLHIGYHKA